ncbi:glycosyltransferase family protein [Peribacillus frigoritolerans]|uniref:Glycosyltransferase n=1 Tax=Peribacillus frigoritolerans TaxID=450367 RepID=A0AAJ1QNR4_9BACI|nr:glycosyltransferase [Peribacillus frigoritolerans]MDM5284687.1 glycosyltransferase [Peribacillus frigoritolerans]
MKQDAILFKGSDVIQIEPLFKELRNTFTYEFWVKPLTAIKLNLESVKGTKGIFGQRYVIGPGHGGSEENAGIGISVGTNGVVVYEHSTNYLPPLLVYPISITEWTHIAVVYHNKTPSLYINGKFRRTGLTSTKKNVYASGLIGGIDPYGYYVGYLKEMKIWNYGRSELEIRKNMNKELIGNERGLFGYWKFNDITNLNELFPKYNKSYKRDLKVLFIKSGIGEPYPALENSIVKALNDCVRELRAVSPQEHIINISKVYKPDIAIFFGSGVAYLDGDKVENLKRLGIKTALWLTDDPYYIDITKSIVSYFDVVFTQENNCVSLYKASGCGKVHILPLAADPEVFKPKEVGEKYKSDILFIGVGFWNRVHLFDSIADYLSKKDTIIIGLAWDRLQNYSVLSHKINSTWVSPEEAASYYNGAKVVINIHRQHDDATINVNKEKINATSINPRTFEISACGALQLTDIRKDLSNFYTPEVDISTYKSPKELIQKIDYYLNHEDERRTIATNGLKKTTELHTFWNRINELLDKIWE